MIDLPDPTAAEVGNVRLFLSPIFGSHLVRLYLRWSFMRNERLMGVVEKVTRREVVRLCTLLSVPHQHPPIPEPKRRPEAIFNVTSSSSPLHPVSGDNKSYRDIRQRYQ